MKERIFNFISKLGGVSFVELSENIDGFNGDYELHSLDNLIAWADMSMEAIDSIRELCKEGRIIPTIANPLVYLVDGMALNYPIAKKQIAYKKPHWIPVVFNVPEKTKPEKTRKCKTIGIKKEVSRQR